MKIEINKPDTVQFNVYLDKEDELYTSCMWARVTFDNKNWTLMAQSDAGNYSYSWCVESGDRTFLQLMSQIDRYYLLGKISNMSKFDLKNSKKALIDFIDGCDKKAEMLKAIEEMESFSSAEEFIDFIDSEECFNELCGTWEIPQYDYPGSAKTFARIFTKYIQPEIKKYIQLEIKK